MRIAHISDLHILHLSNIRAWRYLGKRLTGGLNLLLKRRKSHSKETVIAALEQIDADDVDHIVVTGDLSNLAFESEFAEARDLLSEYAGGPERLSIIPGNHDYYTYNSARTRRFERFFEPWMQSALPDLLADADYPYVKYLGEDVALVGVNSCIPSPPFFAVGRVGSRQRERIGELLSHPEVDRRFTIVALHHHLLPPTHTSRRRETFRRLVDGDAVLNLFRHNNVDLVIHGHNHQWGLTAHTRPDDEVPFYVAEAGSTSTAPHDNPHFGPKYNLYDVERDDAGRPSLHQIVTRIYDPEAHAFITWRTSTPHEDADHEAHTLSG